MADLYYKKDIDNLKNGCNIYISLFIFELITKYKNIIDKLKKIDKDLDINNDKYWKHPEIYDESNEYKIDKDKDNFIKTLLFALKKNNGINDDLKQYTNYYNCFFDDKELNDKNKTIILVKKIDFYIDIFNKFIEKKDNIIDLKNTKSTYNKFKDKITIENITKNNIKEFLTEIFT